jgi:hypothetical protein
MKFHELAVGERFRINNEEYEKIPEVRISCCKIKENAKSATSGQTTVFAPLDEVDKI